MNRILVGVVGGIVLGLSAAMVVRIALISNHNTDSVYGSFPSEVGDRFVHFEDGTYVRLPFDVKLNRVSISGVGTL